jgi:predicted nucleic acid-binding protein
MSDAIVDSCCLINLFAAGNLPTVISTLGRRLYVPAKVLEETLYIREREGGTGVDEPKLVQREVNLTAAFEAGLLHRCDLEGEAELALFVQLAAVLDDGEAACLAIAKARGWTLATDDRKGRREAAALGVPVVTTAELMRAWAIATSATCADVARLLQNIQTFARFTPHKSMPHYQWWVDTASENESGRAGA